MLKQITEWNTVKKIWMIGADNLFSQQYKPYSGRWPISGMMRNGVVYELPMQEHPTTGLESSSSPTQVLGTPTTATSGRSPEFRKGSNPNPVEFVEDLLLLRSPKASEGSGGALGEAEALKRGNTVGVRDQVMDLVASQGLKVSRVSDNLMPTPTVRDFKDGQAEHRRDDVVQTDTVARAVFNSGEVTLLGTPRVSAANSSTPKQVQAGATKSRIEDQVLVTNWGKFAPAIERWESLTRPAPAPTKADGKNGNHRLSAEFTEWMMGLPEGWVTAEDIGLKRNDALKACGNGVVPQQAELALTILLQGLLFESKLRGGQNTFCLRLQ